MKKTSIQPVLFIDRCAWSRKLGEALDAASIDYVSHQSLFKPDASDEDWLKAVQGNGWLILTRDKNIRYRANEHQALVDAELIMFVLAQGSITAEETGHIVVLAWPEMVKQSATTPAPALFSVTRKGEVRRLKLGGSGDQLRS